MRYVTTVIAGGDMQTEYDIERKYSYHEGVNGLLKNHAVIREDMVRPTFNKKYIFDSENEKYVVKYSPEIGHVTLETMVYLFDFINKKPEIEVIIDITDVKSSIDRYEEVGYEKFQVGRFDPSIYDFILQTLEKRKIKYSLIWLESPGDIAIIKNFYIIRNTWITKDSLDSYCSVIEEEVPPTSDEPFRKVYLSRKKVLKRGLEVIPDEIDEERDKDKGTFRITNEPLLEDILVSHGFEIIYPEDFKDFKKQTEFMQTVKVLCSSTSSGLNNMLLMKPGGVVIQFFTPISVVETMPGRRQKLFQQHLHTHYHELCFLRNHDHLAITTHDIDASAIINKIKSSPSLRHIFD